MPTANGTMHGREGTIKAEVSCPGQYGWFLSVLETTHETYTDEQAEAMVGMPLARYVDLPFGCTSEISKASALHRGGPQLDLSVGHSMVNLTTGRIW